VGYASTEYFVSPPRRDTRDDCDLVAVGTCLVRRITGQVPPAGQKRVLGNCPQRIPESERMAGNPSFTD
jgi:hypothetical protein